MRPGDRRGRPKTITDIEYDAIAAAVKAEKRRTGMTLRELGGAIGLSHSMAFAALYKYTQPRALLRMAAHLGVRP